MQLLCNVTFSNADSRISIFFETSNGRLPAEHGSDRRETLGKRVSGNLQVFIFRRWKIFVDKNVIKDFFFKKLAFWRSYEFLSVTGRSVVKSYCPNCLYFWGDFFGEGVNDSKCVETLDLAPKMTSIIWWCDQIFAGQFLFSRNWRFGGARQVWASLACRS